MNISKRDLSTSLVLIVLLVGIALLCGCTVHNIYDPATGHKVASTYSPWAPWFNNEATLANLTLTSETNQFRLGVKGVATRQNADTNVLSAVKSLADFGTELAKHIP